MPYGPILKNIAKHIALNEEEIAFFISLLQQQDVIKKEFMLKEGQLCKNFNLCSFRNGKGLLPG